MSRSAPEIPLPVLESALRAPEECPALEQLLEAAAEGAADELRAPIESHLARCPSCRAELELAHSFAASEDPAAAADVDWIVGRRRMARPAERVPSKVVALASRRRSTSWAPGWRAWASSAAAVAVIAVGVAVVDRGRGPELPDLGGTDVLRGARVELLTALGHLDAPPSSLGWRAVPKAVRYEIVVLGVDGRELAMLESRESAVDLGEVVRGRLEPKVTYRVRVVAFDAAGAVVGRSEAIELRFDRPAER